VFETEHTLSSTLYRETISNVNTPKTDTTIISDGQTILIENSGRSSGEKIFVVEREVKIFPNKANTILEFSIKRIKQKDTFLDVDTDQPFTNDSRNKNVTEHYQTYLGNKKQIVLQDDKITERFEGNLGPWSNFFPKLHRIEELSGIIIEIPENLSDSVWIDSLFTKEYLYINTYSIKEWGKDNVELNLSGYLTPMVSKTLKPGTFDISKYTSGSSIQVGIQITRMVYQGKLTAQNKTGVIQDGELTVDKDYLTNRIGASKFPTNDKLFYAIKNKVK
jgi:hypothetical protein